MRLEALSTEQLELLSALNFHHLPLSQAGMLRLLPPHWERARLQQALNELHQHGWLESDWRVPPRLQDAVARAAWRQKLPVPSPAPLEELRPQLTLRELRLALYSGSQESFAFHWARLRHDFWQPFEREWLDWLPPSILELLTAERLRLGDLSAEESAYLESRGECLQPGTRVEVAFRALLAGRLVTAESLLGGVDTPDAQACLAFAQMQRGRATEAARSYAAARAHLRKLTGRRKVSFTAPYGWLERLALLESGLPAEKTRPGDGPEVLEQIEQFAGGQPVAVKPWRSGRGLEGVLQALLLAWQGRPHPQWQAESQALEQAGQLWLAAEYAYLSGQSELHRQLGTRSLLAVLQPRAPWEVALEALEKLRPAGLPVGHSRRLVWRVEVYRDGASLTMEPVEQRRGPKGWSEGRGVALARLGEGDYLSAADRAICRYIRRVRTGHSGRTDIFIEVEQAAPHLIGHPGVFHRESGAPLKVRAVRPRLRCASRGPDWWLTLELPPVYQIHDGVLGVLRQSSAELGLAAIVGDGMLVPPEGQERFRDLLSELDIHGDFV